LLPSWPHDKRALLVLLSALVIRSGVLLAGLDRLAADPDGYKALASNLVECGVLGRERTPSAYRPPLYPLLLTACLVAAPHDKTAIALVHLLLGVATVWLTLALARRWGLGRFAWLAGALVACDPILLNQSTLIMTETLATFLAAASLASTSAAAEACGRRRIVWAACAGACLGLAALCRPTFLATLLLVAGGIAWTSSSNWRERMRAPAVVLVAAGLMLLPWAARNWRCFGRPIVTTTHGGYTLLLGNNPDYYDFLRTAPWRTVWSAEQLDRTLSAELGTDEAANDRREYQQAWQAIRRQPAMFAAACVHRVASLWGVLPHDVTAGESWLRRAARYTTAVWYLALFLLAGAAVVRRRAPVLRLPWLWTTLFILSFAAVHLVYWTDMRMRAPLVPALSLLAAAGARAVRGAAP
jgi:4-amino-4-deoxy-L-arabinose transferase-like glycosyltransferase